MASRGLVVLGLIVAVRTAAAGIVEGRVTEHGRPVAHAVVQIGDRTAQTDAGGDYRLDLPPGDYTVTVSHGKRASVVRVHVGDGTVALDVKLLAPELELTGPLGTVLDRRYLTDLPVPGHTFDAATGAAPGAQRDRFGLAFAGATSLENQYVVDSVDATGVAYGELQAAVPDEFVRGIGIASNVGPGWGRSTSALVTVDTRCGTNEFHGSVFGTYSSSALAADAHDTYQGGATIRTRSDLGYDAMLGGEVGGPIVRDHLWFYAGFAPTFGSTDVTRTVHRLTDCRVSGSAICDPTKADGVPDVDGNGELITDVVDTRVLASPSHHYTALAKLDAAIDRDQQGGVSLFVDPSALRSPVVSGETSAETETSVLVTDLGAHWTANLGGFELKAALGWHRSSYDNAGAHADSAHLRRVDRFFASFAEAAAYESAAAVVACTDGGSDPYPSITNCPAGASYATGGPGTIQHAVEQRVATRISVARLLGDHRVEAGLELTDATAESGHLYSGGEYDVRDAAIVTVDQRFDFAPRGPTDPRFDKICYAPQYGPLACQLLGDTFGAPGTLARTSSLEWAWYLRDVWQPRPDIAIDLGLRTQSQRLRNPEALQNTTSVITGVAYGENLVELSDNVAPRIGVAYDPTSEGRAKLFAHWGRYYETVPLYVGESGSNGLVRYEYGCLGAPGCTEPSPLGTFVFVPSEPAPALDVRAEYSDELVLGGQLEILPDLVAGAVVRDRRLGSVIEDVSIDDGASLALANPGKGVATMYDRPERVYDAIELTLSRRFTQLFVLASYTYARTYGDYDGNLEYSNGQAAPNLTSVYDRTWYMPNRRGALALDRPHQVKLDASYTISFGRAALVLGGRLRVLSGTPELALSADPLTGSDSLYLLGSSAFGRTDAIRNVDLHVVWRQRFARATGELFVDVFDVFDSQPATALDNAYTPNVATVYPISGGTYQDLIWAKQTTGGGVETATPATRNPNFHHATERGAPLTARIGFRLSF